jgi:hypothetical protein
MSNLVNLWGREPAMVLALVQAVIVLGVSFGLALTTEQTGAILALTAVVLGLLTRSQVFPTKSTAGVAATQAANEVLAAPYIPNEKGE